MNKKVFVLLLVTITFSYFIFKIIVSMVNNTVDEANKRGIELYVSAIKYAYTSYYYKNSYEPNSIDDLNINLITKVKCEYEKIDDNGKIELRNCTVDDSKNKYSYINNKIVKE